MAKFSADYTVDDVLELYRQRSSDGDEARLRSLAIQFRLLCRLEHPVNIPEQYKAITRDVRTPFVRDALNRITASLVAKTGVVHCEPLDQKREEFRDAANVAERWDLALLERQNKELGRDLVYSLISQMVRDGESVLKVVHKPDAWANFPNRESAEEADDYQDRAAQYKRGADLPIAWRDVDRLSCLFEDGEYGDLWALEYGEYAKPYLKRRYGFRQNDDGRLVTPESALTGQPMPEGLQATSGLRSVKVEFVTDREWHVIVDGHEAPGFPKPNPYSPHLHLFRARAQDSESLLYSLLYLVPRLDELLTMKLNWGVLSAYPTPVLENAPNAQGFPGLEGPLGNAGDATAAGQAVVKFVLGKLFEVPLGKTLRYLEPPASGKDLNDLIMIFRSLVDIAGIPSVFRGVGGSGDSGYLANQLMAAASTAYRIASLASQRQLEKALEFSHWLIPSVIKQSVYVFGWTEIDRKTGRPKRRASNAWLGLTDQDKGGANLAPVSKLGPVTYKLRPTLPTDEEARAMIGTQLVAGGLSSKRHALEKWLEEEDPDSILDEIAVERAMETPPLSDIITENALREAGLLPAATQNLAAALVGPTGQPLLPPGPGQLQAAPATQMPPGGPAVRGVNMPIQPGRPRPTGRPAGMYPGQPGGPNA